MQIEVADDVGEELHAQARYAGFSKPGDYVSRLLGMAREQRIAQAKDALERIRELRASVPKMTREEIIELIQEGRERRP